MLLAVGLLLGGCAHGSSGTVADAPSGVPKPTKAHESAASDEIGRRALADAVAASSAIVVATARIVDDRGGLKAPPHEGGTTRVVLAIEHVLVGAATPGERELWLDGGVLPDGSILGYSEGPPDLSENDRYVLFLHEAPQSYGPFVRFEYAVLRIVRFGEHERVVDAYGHGVVADPRRGLRRLGKISESTGERRLAQDRARGSDATYVSQDRLVPADIERTSELRDVLAVIAAATKRTQ